MVLKDRFRPEANEAETALLQAILQFSRREESIAPMEITRRLLEAEEVIAYAQWGGVKSLPNGVGEANLFDDCALDSFTRFEEQMGQFGIRPTNIVVFSDPHAIVINGEDPEKVKWYYNGLSGLAQERGIGLVRLSKLYQQAEEENPDWEEAVKRATSWVLVKFAMDSEFQSLLIERARKYSKAKNPEEAAFKYALARRLEMSPEGLFERFFPGGIRLSFARRSTEMVFGKLPTLYPELYPRPDGWSNRAWRKKLKGRNALPPWYMI